jgi:hypothetical protein
MKNIFDSIGGGIGNYGDSFYDKGWLLYGVIAIGLICLWLLWKLIF